MTVYFPSISETLYSGDYPDMIEFRKPWESCIQVGQGRGNISSDGKSLQSEGFGKCCALILKNAKTSESALFHIDDINLNEKQTPIVEQVMQNYIESLHLSDEEKRRLLALASGASRFWNVTGFTQKPYSGIERDVFISKMRELNSDSTMRACFVMGDVSRDIEHRVMGELLNNFGIHTSTNILVQTGAVHWGILYKPAESVIIVDSRKYKKSLNFSF